MKITCERCCVFSNLVGPRIASSFGVSRLECATVYKYVSSWHIRIVALFMQYCPLIVSNEKCQFWRLCSVHSELVRKYESMF